LLIAVSFLLSEQGKNSPRKHRGCEDASELVTEKRSKAQFLLSVSPVETQSDSSKISGAEIQIKIEVLEYVALRVFFLLNISHLLLYELF